MHLIIPAYNEEARLPATLDALRVYAESNPTRAGRIDVTVVDNASTDRTAEVARDFDNDALPVSVLRCATPGKGAAVRAGVMSSTADVVAFMDADGATDLSALGMGLSLLEGGADMAIGSRAVDGSLTMDRHSRLRQMGAAVYRRQTVRIAPGIADTQCGFKLMRGDIARRVFAPLSCTGFSFDVEVLGRAQRLGARIAEFPVVWIDVPGSTFHPARHGVVAFWELAWIGRRLGSPVPASAAEPVIGELPVLLNGVAEF
jgi:dolichyl-phosphate beta-glucosyltransferase